MSFSGTPTSGANNVPYMGLSERNPRETYTFRRDPTVNDYKAYKIGDRWINDAADTAFILVSKANNVAIWLSLSGSAGALNITPDIGVNITNSTFFMAGASVVAGGAPVQTNGVAANSLRIDVQRASAQAVSTVAANGVSHFDSSQFTVDASGFVQSLSTGSIVWQDSAPGALAFSNGYFATGAGAYTLPLGTTDGQTIEIVDQAGGGVVVTAAGAQLIQISNVLSSAGGTATSTLSGDALRLIFRATLGNWICVPGAAGNWILA